MGWSSPEQYYANWASMSPEKKSLASKYFAEGLNINGAPLPDFASYTAAHPAPWTGPKNYDIQLKPGYENDTFPYFGHGDSWYSFDSLRDMGAKGGRHDTTNGTWFNDGTWLVSPTGDAFAVADLEAAGYDYKNPRSSILDLINKGKQYAAGAQPGTIDWKYTEDGTPVYDTYAQRFADPNATAASTGSAASNAAAASEAQWVQAASDSYHSQAKPATDFLTWMRDNVRIHPVAPQAVMPDIGAMQNLVPNAVEGQFALNGDYNDNVAWDSYGSGPEHRFFDPNMTNINGYDGNALWGLPEGMSPTDLMSAGNLFGMTILPGGQYGLPSGGDMLFNLPDEEGTNAIGGVLGGAAAAAAKEGTDLGSLFPNVFSSGTGGVLSDLLAGRTPKAGDVGGALGTIAGIATGNPLLSLVGKGVGNAVGVYNANNQMETAGAQPGVGFGDWLKATFWDSSSIPKAVANSVYDQGLAGYYNENGLYKAMERTKAPPTDPSNVVAVSPNLVQPIPPQSGPITATPLLPDVSNLKPWMNLDGSINYDSNAWKAAAFGGNPDAYRPAWADAYISAAQSAGFSIPGVTGGAGLPAGDAGPTGFGGFDPAMTGAQWDPSYGDLGAFLSQNALPAAMGAVNFVNPSSMFNFDFDLNGLVGG